jgi:hypothetical protein
VSLLICQAEPGDGIAREKSKKEKKRNPSGAQKISTTTRRRSKSYKKETRERNICEFLFDEQTVLKLMKRKISAKGKVVRDVLGSL